jgi:pilus assembly protein CpaC
MPPFKRLTSEFGAGVGVALLVLIAMLTLFSISAEAESSKLTSDVSERQSDRRRMLLTAGEDRAVDLEFEANAGANGISIGNPTVVATTLVKVGEQRQIVFKPLKAGDTTVTVRDLDGTIRLIFNVKVTGTNLLRIAGQLRNILRDVEGLDIRVVGNRVLVEGELLVPADYGALVTVLSDKEYAETTLNMAKLSPLAMSVLAKRIQEDINTFGPNVKTRVVNGVIFLEGTVDNVDQARRAAKVALIYMPELRPGNPMAIADKPEAVGLQVPRSLIQNFIVVNPPPPRKQEKLVRVTLHFVELAKDYNKFFGFKWEPGFTLDPQIAVGSTAAGGVVGNTGPSFSATISSLIPKLQTAQEAGYARILRMGTVVVRSGQPATLVEQTEFPFFQPGAAGTNNLVAGKQPVGLEVGVTPRILGQSEDIEMDLKMNQITFVSRTSGGGPPITANHKVETKVYIKSNETAAVASVNSTDVGTDFNKDDPAARANDTGDPIFTLRRSKNFRKKKSQTVIFVTPQIIENASEGTEDLKKNFRLKVN